MIRNLLIGGFALLSICSTSAVIHTGDDSSKLIPELGEPLGKIQLGDKTVYSYPQGVIHVKDGKVIHVSEGFYEKQNQFTRKTASGESIDLDQTDENLVSPADPEAPSITVEWLTDYYEALNRAHETGKPIFMLFTQSGWHLWSVKFEREILTTPQFLEYASENLILLLIDFPKDISEDDVEMQKRLEFREEWNVKTCPSYVLISSDAVEYGRMDYGAGQMDPDEFVTIIRLFVAAGEKKDSLPEEEKSSSPFVDDIRNLLGDDVADAFEKLEFVGLDRNAVMLSIQGLLGSILVYYVIRRLIRR